jgi:hypothetical protein
VKERPIRFTDEMINAIREGRKTQTRRVVKFRDGSLDTTQCHYGSPGDVLLVTSTNLRIEITNVRVERLQAISNTDAIAEGLKPVNSPLRPEPMWSIGPGSHCAYPRDAFMVLWASIYGLDSWRFNPLVWVIGFKAVTP